MRCLLVGLSLVLGLLSLAEPALAQGASKPVTPVAVPGIRTDPRGITGVSPTWRAIAKGDAAAVARDYDGAIATYKEAIAKDSNNAMLYYRVAQVQLLKGDLKEAETAYQSALGLVGNDATLKAKIIFCLADLGERQKAYDLATSRWTDYQAHAQAQPKAKAYPETAAERKKRITEWLQISKDSAEAKIRNEQRPKAAEPSKKNLR